MAIIKGEAWRNEVEKRLDRLTIRGLVAETLFATVTALVLRTVAADVRRKLISELRNGVSVTVNAPAALAAEGATVALETEEWSAQLLDQIERLATMPAPPAARPLKQR